MSRVTTLMGTEIAGRVTLDLDEANMFDDHKGGVCAGKVNVC